MGAMVVSSSSARARIAWPLSLVVALGVLALLGPPGAAGATEGTPEGAQTSERTMVFAARPGRRTGESSDQAALARFERDARRPLGAVREFVRWDQEFPDAFHQQLKASGQPMLFSVKSQLLNGTKIRFADVAAAQPGSPLYADLVGWAERIKAYGAPMYFTYNHEPESSVSHPMGEDFEFIAAWRRVHEVFAEQGVTNVKWMWIMTDYAFMVGPTARNYGPKWYPGDAYVDAMAVDAYNWHNCRIGVSNRWKTLEEIIRPFRDFGALHPDEELWLAEYASTEDPDQPGRKAAWYAEAQALFKRADHAQFVGVSQFDVKGQGSCQWYYDSSPSALAAYQTWGDDPFWGGPGLIPPPEPQPEPEPVPAPVEPVAAVGTNGNRLNHSVTVPTTVRPGDALLLHWAANTTKGTVTPPTGWTEITTTASTGMRSGIWHRTAQPGDPGTKVTLTTSAYAKSDLTLSAYRSTHPTPVTDWRTTLTTTTSSTHTAPAVTPAHDGSLVVVYAADKSATNTTLATPPDLTRRHATTGTGSGRITAVLADTTAPTGTPTGTPAGPWTLQGTSTASTAALHTLVLRPGT